MFDEARLKDFVAPIDALTGTSPSMTMFDGSRASLATGNSAFVNGTNDSIHLLLSFAPKIISSTVQLDVVATLTLGRPANPNLIACRARIPNGGALIVDCSQAKAVDGRHYWFVFSPLMPGPGVTAKNGISVLPPPRAYSTTPPHGSQ